MIKQANRDSFGCKWSLNNLFASALHHFITTKAHIKTAKHKQNIFKRNWNLKLSQRVMEVPGSLEAGWKGREIFFHFYSFCNSFFAAEEFVMYREVEMLRWSTKVTFYWEKYCVSKIYIVFQFKTFFWNFYLKLTKLQAVCGLFSWVYYSEDKLLCQVKCQSCPGRITILETISIIFTI